MKPRISGLLAVGLVIAIGLGCDLAPGSKYDHRFSVQSWEAIDAGNCLAIGTYVMGLDFAWNPAQAKSQIKLTTEFKEDRELLPDGLEIRYSRTSGMTTSTLYDIFYSLKNGKGKTDFILSPMTLLEGDEIGIEACNVGAEGTTIPIHTRFDWRLSLKFDKAF